MELRWIVFVFVSSLVRPVKGSLSVGHKTCLCVYIEEKWSDSVKRNPKCWKSKKSKQDSNYYTNCTAFKRHLKMLEDVIQLGLDEPSEKRSAKPSATKWCKCTKHWWKYYSFLSIKFSSYSLFSVIYHSQFPSLPQLSGKGLWKKDTIRVGFHLFHFWVSSWFSYKD